MEHCTECHDPMKIIGYLETYDGGCFVVHYCDNCKRIIKEEINDVGYID